MATINLGSGNDVRSGTSGADSIYGNGGTDTLRGLAGDDLLAVVPATTCSTAAAAPTGWMAVSAAIRSAITARPAT